MHYIISTFIIKTMKKITNLMAIAATTVVVFFCSNAKAQTTAPNNPTPWRLGIGLETGLTDATQNYSKFELGGTARLQYDTKGPVSFMLTSGYYNLFAKNYSGKDIGIVPVKLGAKIFFSPKWYFSGEAGAGFETREDINTGKKDTKLILSPGIGYASHCGLDVGLRYENLSGQDYSYGIIGLRIAYGFKL
jgi:hypothetical protein